MDSTSAIAICTLLIVAAVLLLRLLAAPFFVWKVDQAQIEGLTLQLSLPDSTMRDAMLQHRVQLRTELGQRLGSYVTSVRNYTSTDSTRLRGALYNEETHLADMKRGTELINQVGYDVPLRIASAQLLTFASDCFSACTKGNLTPEMSERLRKQNKLTYQIIHKSHPLGDMVAFAELNQFLSEHGKGLGEIE